MRNAIEYTGRLLIVEAPDSDWNMTAYLVISVDRWNGGRRVVGWSETWKVGRVDVVGGHRCDTGLIDPR